VPNRDKAAPGVPPPPERSAGCEPIDRTRRVNRPDRGRRPADRADRTRSQPGHARAGRAQPRPARRARAVRHRARRPTPARTARAAGQVLPQQPVRQRSANRRPGSPGARSTFSSSSETRRNRALPASNNPDLTAAAHLKRAHGRRLYAALSVPSSGCADRRWCVLPRWSPPEPGQVRDEAFTREVKPIRSANSTVTTLRSSYVDG
jgi:hypothetical protein